MMTVHILKAIFEVCFNKISLDVYTLGKKEIKNESNVSNSLNTKKRYFLFLNIL